MGKGSDVESGVAQGIPWVSMVLNQGVLTQEIIDWHYKGSGTDDDPYIVKWIDDDPRNPMQYSEVKKWSITMVVAMATLAVAFVSSAYSGGVKQIITHFSVGQEVVTLGISLFVLGFAIGPLLWAPMSELYGRQYLFAGTYAMLTFFNAGAAASQNIWTLLILRFFAGAFGSSPLTNAGGVIADMFPASERGMAMSIFAAAPFMGPVLGPIVGGFVGETIGWRWVEGVMAIFTGFLWIIGCLVLPETYAPVLLRRRAQSLSKLTGKIYLSQMDHEQGKISAAHAFKTSLTRPWVLLLKEPIVFLLSIYMAIVYGTLYMLFAAFPIVFQQNRGWSQGIGGLAFIGIAIGMLAAVSYSIYDNKRYVRVSEQYSGGFAPPEARLPPAMIGGVAIPVGLFWFAWTNYPSISWAASIAAGIPFGFGMVLVFLAIMNYLIDAYTIFAASVLAANAVMRSLFGAAFPLFTSYMFASLGIHWASSVPAFLALMCVPFPFLFYKYGPAIRRRCLYAAEADKFLRQMRGEQESNPTEEKENTSSVSDENLAAESDNEKTSETAAKESKELRLLKQRRDDIDQEAYDYSYEDASHAGGHGSRFESIKTGRSSLNKSRKNSTSALQRTVTSQSAKSQYYECNPYDIDRVNTKDHFVSNSRNASRTASGTASRTASRTASATASAIASRRPSR